MLTQHREFIAFRGSHLSEPLTLPKCSTSAHNQILEMLPDQYRLSHAYFSLSLDTTPILTDLKLPWFLRSLSAAHYH